jgi:hypothetical protein
MKEWFYTLISNPEIFFTALSGIGTFFLGFISIWLAKRKPKIILGGWIETILMTPDSNKVISIKCINNSIQDITVYGCDIKFKDSDEAIMLRYFNNEFPKRLSYLEDVNLVIEGKERYEHLMDSIVVQLKKNIEPKYYQIPNKCKKLIARKIQLTFRVHEEYENNVKIGNGLLKVLYNKLSEEHSDGV